jgi:hypothetical protein
MEWPNREHVVRGSSHCHAHHCALLVGNRLPISSRTYLPISLLGRQLYKGRDGEPRVRPPLLSHPQSSSGPVPQHPPLFRRYQQREGEVHTIAPPPKWAQGIRCKARIYARLLEHHAVLPPVPYNVIPSPAQASIHRPNDARITVVDREPKQHTIWLKAPWLGKTFHHTLLTPLLHTAVKRTFAGKQEAVRTFTVPRF